LHTNQVKNNDDDNNNNAPLARHKTLPKPHTLTVAHTGKVHKSDKKKVAVAVLNFWGADRWRRNRHGSFVVTIRHLPERLQVFDWTKRGITMSLRSAA
jgi:hypothetical protein